MKKRFQYIVLVVLLIIVFCACKKDLGNYDYKDANVITITTDTANVDRNVVITADSIVVKQNDSLKVNILLSQTIPSNDLAFEWMITQSTSFTSNPAQYVVGNGKDLRTKIVLPPNLYKLVVKVTDRTTGVSFYKFYMLNVDTSPWGGEGWMVLQDQPAAGGCDISVITSRDGVTRGNVYSNLYFAANGHKLPVGTYKVNAINYSAPLRIQKVSFFYPNGGLQVRSTDFADSSDHTSWYLVAPSTNNLQLNGMVNGGQYEYQVNNSQLYYRKVNALTIKEPPIKFGAPVLGTWTASPFVLNNSGSEQYFTMYDQANKCFLLYNAESSTLIPTNRPDVANSHFVPYAGVATALHPTTGSGFDLNNIGRNLVYAENVLPYSSGTSYNCFFRNNAGDSTWLYQFAAALSYSNNFIAGRSLLTTAKLPGINGATMFACPTFLALPGKFYYVNSNTIYTATVATLAASTATVGYTFPAGTVIKAMKVFKAGYVTAPATDGKVLVVATDETASGGGHKVYFLNLSATGDINATPANVYTGFDKIVDIAFKKGLGL
jgi:hypothetical protein